MVVCAVYPITFSFNVFHVHPCSSFTYRYRHFLSFQDMKDTAFKQTDTLMSDIDRRRLIRKIGFKITPFVFVVSCLSVCYYVTRHHINDMG